MTVVAAVAGASACVASSSEQSRLEDPPAANRGAVREAPAARPAATGIRLLRVATFNQPTYVAAPRGQRLRRFVTERAGRVIVMRGRRKLARPFLDIRSRVSTAGEGGLLSIAFAPDYARTRRFYIYYVDRRGTLRVDQYRRSARSAERVQPGSRRTVIRQPHRRENHKGGQLQFGPDGMLYMGFGDGGGSGDPDRNAQNLGRLLGKLLRVSPKAGGGYRIPRDNPFRGRRGVRWEIFDYGLRNPYRFSFDRATGDLTIADVGQDAVEEVDFTRRRSGARRPAGGRNYGWSVFEGRRRYRSGSAPGAVAPVLERSHSRGACSITGGYVLRDRTLPRSFRGRYVYGDLCDPQLRIAKLRSGGARGDRRLGLRVPQLVSFGEDSRGRAYAVSLNGPVYRLAPRR